MQLSPEPEMVSCNNSGPEYATITHVNESFLTWAIWLSRCSLGWGMITESGLIFSHHTNISAALSQLLGPARMSCHCAEIWGRKTKEETLKTLIPHPDRGWPSRDPDPARGGRVCTVKTFSIDLLLGCCQKSFILGKGAEDPELVQEGRGNQQSWAWMAPWVL